MKVTGLEGDKSFIAITEQIGDEDFAMVIGFGLLDAH